MNMLKEQVSLKLHQQHTSQTKEISPKQDILIIVILLAVALCIRLYSLKFFHVISTDGTSYALTARAFAQGDLHGIGTYGFYPVLIAAANFFINDLETSGRIISVIFGTFIVLPLYLLGKSIFSRNVAIAASLVSTVWPPFVSSSCEVITQATHTTLQLASICLIWYTFRKPSAIKGICAGILIGLTYLTRPESILLVLAMPLALAVLEPEKLVERKRSITFYIFGFTIPFLANMILVHHMTGEWQLSAKTDSALNDALSYYLNLPDLNYVPGYEPKSYVEILKEHPGFIWHNLAKNLKMLWKSLLPPTIWVMFAVGFLSGGFKRESNIKRLFLFATITPVVVLVIFYYIDSGYIQAYQPFIFLFAAYGLTTTGDKIKVFISGSLKMSTILQRTPLLLPVAIIYAAILLAPQIRKNTTDAEYWPYQDDGRRSEKHIGKLLKAKLPPGKIMTRWARIAFYAEREWVNVPVAYFDEIIKTARENKVRFLIADGLLYENRPGFGLEIFKYFMDRNIPSGLHINTDPSLRIKGLKPVLIYKSPRSIGVIVYEIPY
ncbi:MAG: glycosyltransferase family 39 protein [Geobacteraceae bacterium]|nr:glycosyltransferase family 39 protein [Geobacteraceae bacterium]